MRQPILLYPPNLAANFIAEQEGFSGLAYKCPAGVWTIGFGHTKDVREGDAVTRSEAYQLLSEDLVKTQEELASLVKVPVTENQFIALMSWLYNLGNTMEVRRSKLLRELNSGKEELAAQEFPRWVKSGNKIIKGLVLRREREKELFVRGR